MITDLDLKRIKTDIIIALAKESRKSLHRFFDGHKPTKKRCSIVSKKSIIRFYRKTRYKKMLFLNKNKENEYSD